VDECKPLPCGGWGESYLSCQNKKYVHLPGLKPHVAGPSGFDFLSESTSYGVELLVPVVST
jgi:hypothetical protein